MYIKYGTVRSSITNIALTWFTVYVNVHSILISMLLKPSIHALGSKNESYLPQPKTIQK